MSTDTTLRIFGAKYLKYLKPKRAIMLVLIQYLFVNESLS